MGSSSCDAPVAGGNDTFEVVVRRTRQVAASTLLLELALPGGGDLPSYSPGAHISLYLEGGLERQYSLLHPYEQSRSCYTICVKLSAQGQGGSRYIHSHVSRGAALRIGRPVNYFPLEEDAAHSVFIAGGIGITPIWCMVSRLRKLGRSWELHYAVGSRSDAVCIDQVQQLAPRARCCVSDETPARIDIPSIVGRAPAGSHLYCCGPQRMLGAFRDATRDLPKAQVHFESFGSAAQDGGDSGTLTVELAQDGRVFQVPPGQTILDCLRAAGVDLPFSCRQGVCGACETKVLAGVPEHRDMVLSEAERRSNRTMIICCSRGTGSRLVLDL